MIDDLAKHGYAAQALSSTVDAPQNYGLYIRTGGTIDFVDNRGGVFTGIEVAAGTYFLGPLRQLRAVGGGATVLFVCARTPDPAI